jgi:hypothetical protein
MTASLIRPGVVFDADDFAALAARAAAHPDAVQLGPDHVLIDDPENYCEEYGDDRR